MSLSRRALLQTAAAASAVAQGPATSQRPNILFLISDDHSWADLGCYGNAAARTPNLDQLASQGARYTRCFVTSPQCSPNRSSILTGMPPHQTATSRLHSPMPTEQQTMLEPLREYGYHLGAFRKVHQGPEFDKRWNFYGDAKASFASFFSQRPKDRPFFLHVGLTDPHRPYKAGAFSPPTDPKTIPIPRWLPDTPEVRQDLAHYLDAIARMDRDAGEVLRLLEESGQAGNTLVVFTGDNGMPFPPKGKGTLYDHGIRVPLLARWPGKIKPGTVDERLVAHIDLPVTWLEAAGVRKPQRMTGVSLLTGQRNNEVFSERNWHDNFDLCRSIRTARHKLIYNGMPDKPNRPIQDLASSPSWTSYLALGKAGKLSPEHQQILAPTRALLELYDLEKDPHEVTNLAGQPEHAAVQKQLLGQLSQWMDNTNDFLPPPYRLFQGTQRPTL